eukprot:TRINITY_DN12483_c0_g1_i4.p1 TRINITY_DN12483_c0_g1~~TRINITY_DN12483_c0_g1_i4.p1  ORF type:complete len:1013 (+),score=316.78 TRINITY_DN12483_c0_g1_i4:28-3066(+)
MVALTCLLPTGMLVKVNASSSQTFTEIKESVWKFARDLPFFRELKQAHSYGFQGVNQDGELVDLPDDDTYASAKLFSPLLKLFLRKGTRDEQNFNFAISGLIGKQLNKYDYIQDAEVASFRRSIIQVCRDAVEARSSRGRDGAAEHRFPPNVSVTPFPEHLKSKLKKGEQLMVVVKIGEAQSKQICKINDTPDAFIASLVKRARVAQALGSSLASDYVLKVLGRDEYFLGNYKMGQYNYVRDKLAGGYAKTDMSDVDVRLVLERRDGLYRKIPEAKADEMLMKQRPPKVEEGPKGPQAMTWFAPEAESKFSIKIEGARNVITGKLFSVGISACIYLGDRALCPAETTRYIPPDDNLNWGEVIEFDLSIKDIPRDARLCLSLHGVWANPLKVKKNKKNFRNEYALAWVNIAIMDHRGYLRQGTMDLATWTVDDGETAKLFNPLGTTIINMDEGSSPTLRMSFTKFQREMCYPPEEYTRQQRIYDSTTNPCDAATKKRIQTLVQADPLHEFSDEELNLLREHREQFKENPAALSKCLRAIDWRSHEAVYDVAEMLSSWAALKPEMSLEILDAAFSDRAIRSHAVQRLEPMSDDVLLSYLLQLVQVLKYETYLECDLAKFLLRRALKNQRVGHFFFWYLKSEIHLPEVSVRFGLLLEAYCRGCGSHMSDLKAQVEMLKQVEVVGDEIKEKQIKDKKEYAIAALSKANFTAFQLPLEPSIRLTKVEVKKVFGSAQKPLWLRFDNEDPDGAQYNVMFKNGDDLRQDMLTLQLIHIMDQLWKENGLDLQMNAYACLATGDMVGMLEMVMKAETLWGIQGKIKNVMWSDDVLDKWIHDKNPTPEGYAKASRAFMVSCAGYSVATYVLGIADRHNDNIMLKENGEFFHIDFGHFLGNWKSKFGIKRERVKFILVPDFIHIITQGEGQKSKRWTEFIEICKKAFVIVRRNAHVFINLLNMMLMTGIPELTSHKDVSYLRETLYLDLDEKAALDAFQKEIDLAVKGSNTVKINWAFHGAKHG